MHYTSPMKSAQLPPVRVEPSVRREIESALQEGESLSEFVLAATLEVARRRKAQEAFLARGRASLARARRSGRLHAIEPVLQEMEERLTERVKALRAAAGADSRSK